MVALAVQHPLWPSNAVPLRRLPVHCELSTIQVLAQMAALQPAVVVCCGMAEARSHLTLEQYARRGDRRLRTDLDLAVLCHGLGLTTLSEDAGNYVCNHLYFDVLTAIATGRGTCRGLFVHVPCLHPRTQPWLLLEFLTVLHRVQAIASGNANPVSIQP
jgi:pyroglutamyl-peptidase